MIRSRVAAALALTGVAAASSAGALTPSAAAGPHGLALAVHAEGPPLAHTGGFGEPTCRACHAEVELNPEGGRLSLEGWPEVYEPGRSYPLTVLLESDQMGAAGFQLAIRSEAGTAAGTLTAIGARVAVRDSAGVAYAQHTRSGTAVADAERTSWTLNWAAPDSGAVTVNVAANSANGDDSPFGDYIYAAELRARPAPPPGIR